ncbi:serine/threonine-protein kinase [Actinokineospora inagensis]|uniref:serine/threonine-protein kinase n=1 Tax=Actinokineospora inagensis TaxID=103730 RepID=UPI0004199BEA|nr:serine/threonine-protein kinase [Actinokineospora inagensis]
MTSEQTLVAGRYRLGARIGSGAMGVVWQARDERLHRTVAVKQLLSQPGLTEEQAEEARLRAMREGRIAARLAHPNAITVYDVAEHDGEPWLIMEYLPSKSLATVLNEREVLPPVESARIGTQVAAALVAAHAAGIVHRDVKPANVLLGEDGTVKITDFGISRATGDITVTATGMLAGTPAYLAPEVAKGEAPTPAADVFSLGSTLYTAVEGHSPFGLSENTLALLYAVAAGKVTPPRQAGPLTALLMQLLRADPTERPTMTAAKDALAAVAAGKPLPSVAMLNQRTVPAPMPQRPAVPAGGTRLDVNPFAEPTPSGPMRQQQPPMQNGLGGPVGPPRNYGPRTPAGGVQRAPAPAPDNKKRDVRSVLLTILAIVAAALIGILVASLVGSKHNANAASSTTSETTTLEPMATTAASRTTTTSTTSTTTSTPTTTSATPTTTGPSAADLEAALRNYYSLLPGNPQAAWALLTDRARAKSHGYDEFANFYQDLTAVEVVTAQGQGNKVAAQIRFTTKKNRVTQEPYVYVFVQQNGTLMIDNFAKAPNGG